MLDSTVIVINILETILIARYMTFYLKQKINFFIVLAITLFLETTISNYFISFDYFLPAIIIITTTIIGKYFSKRNIYEIVFVISLVELILAGGNIIVLLLFQYFTDHQIIAIVSPYLALVTKIVFSVNLYLLSKLKWQISDEYWISLAAITFSFGCITDILVACLFGQKLDLVMVSIGLIISLFTILILVYVFNRVSLEQVEKENLRLSLERQKYDQDIYFYLERLNEKNKIFSHDLKHYNLYMKELLQNNKIEKALEILEVNTVLKQEMTDMVMTNNQYINSLINHKIMIANSKMITILCDLVVEKELCIEPYDLYMALGNILDNAIEHCSGTYKEIIVGIKSNENMLLIEIKNTIQSSVLKQNSKLQTSKENKEEHGYGLKSIQDVVNKYNGNLVIEEENNLFIISILITK